MFKPKPVSVEKDILPCVEKLLDPSKGSISRREWQYLFQDVHKMCTAIPEPRTDELYGVLETHLIQHVTKLRKEISGRQSDVLKSYCDRFTVFYRGAENVDKAFKYMNDEIEKKVSESHKVSYYTRPQSSNKQVFPLALHTWKTELFEPLKQRILHEVLHVIEQDRNGETADLWVVQGTLASIVNMTEHEPDRNALYIKTFEEPFLQATSAYYGREADKFLAETDCSSFMKKAGARLKEELVRGQKVLQCDTLNKATAVCLEKIVVAHQDVMMAECVHFVERRQVSDLTQMYDLLRRVEHALAPMLRIFEDHVVAEGKQTLASLVSESSLSPATFVEALIALHTKYSALVQEAFGNDPVFVSALDKACSTTVNQTAVGTKTFSSPELLAKFCDSVLKKSSKNASDTDLEDRLSGVVTVFKYVNDKDIFQKFYSRMLAKRLIHGSSLSEEAEESMISRLKQLCGYEYTSKLQRMFTDVSLSGELNARFQEQASADMPFAFRILVLQAGSWPLSASSVPEFLIPTQLEKCISCFETFYGERFTGRRLDWMHHLGTAEVKAYFKAGKFEFTVSEFQLGMLLMFQNTDCITVGEAKSQCCLPEKEFQRTVKSLLACNVVHSSTGTDLEPGTELKLNLKYSNRKRRLKLSSAIQKETPQEAQQTRKAVDDDRKLFLQASIVRVMKSRKTLSYTDLIQEVVAQAVSRFKPSVPQIKKCIEELIDKAYLERKENERSQLFYVA